MEWDNESIVKQLQAGQDIITALHTAHTETPLKRLQVSSCTCMGRMSIYRTPEITQKGHGKMEELKKSIKQKEKEMEKKKAERQAAKVEEFAALDRDILMLELQIKQLEESQHIQELREKGETPMDELTRARLHMAELIDQLCEEGRDMNGSDPRLTASARLLDVIGQMELLKMAGEPMEHTDFTPAADFMEPLNVYISAKREKVENAKEKLAAQDSEIQHIETLLADATAAGNPEEIIAYSELLENTRKTKQYLEPMVQAAEQGDTFPAGTISNVWKEICSLYRHEYLLRLEIINAAQDIHLRACNELIELANNLRGLRSEIQRIGRENGSPDEIERYNAQITSGADLSKIREIRRDQYDGLNRYIYFDKEKLL